MYNPTEAIGSVNADLSSTVAENLDLKSRIQSFENMRNMDRAAIARYVVKINNVKEYIVESYQEAGKVSDELAEIANMLGIELTKPISGEATFTISWRAEVPLDFDPNDMQISFSADCQSDVEDFDYDEIDTNIIGEEY